MTFVICALIIKKLVGFFFFSSTNNSVLKSLFLTKINLSSLFLLLSLILQEWISRRRHWILMRLINWSVSVIECHFCSYVCFLLNLFLFCNLFDLSLRHKKKQGFYSLPRIFVHLCLFSNTFLLSNRIIFGGEIKKKEDWTGNKRKRKK